MVKIICLTRKFVAILVVLFLVCIVSCEEYEFIIEEDNKPEITAFILKKSDNPQLKEDVFGIIEANKISVVIDYKISDLIFYPTIEYHKDISIIPSAFQEIDASQKMKYTIYNGKEYVEYEVEFYLVDGPLKLKSINVNGTPAYYNSKTDIYHVPVDQSKWGEAYAFEAIGGGISETFVNGKKVVPNEAISMNLRFGEKYELKVTKGDKSESLTFVLSGLPIVSVKANYHINNVPPKGKERGSVYLSVYDPTEGGQYSIESKYAGIRMRGNSSSKKEKRPYSLEFQEKETKEEVDVRLLGLRSDGDWILDAVATDVARVRNRICTDIWNDMYTLSYIDQEPNAIPATRGRMTELYFNDEYRGIYCVTERVDRKQLNLDDENGYLYKTEGWDNHVKFKSYDKYRLPREGAERWEENDFGYQAEYPKDPSTKWEPLIDLVQFVCDSDDKTLALGISERFDIDNLVDFFIFINALGATDNSSRNAFLGIYNKEGEDIGDRRFFYSPWDLDATFGRNWNAIKIEPGFVIGIEEWSGEANRVNHLMQRLARTNGAEFGTKVKKRWSELKNNIYSKEAIIERFRDYQTELEDSGAYQRESEKWRDAEELDSEIAYVDGWLETHLDFLDRYIQNWDSNVSDL